MALRQSAFRGRLQDEPARTRRARVLSQGRLLFHAGPRDGDGHGHPARHVRRYPVHQGAALLRAQLVYLRPQPQNGDAVSAPRDAGLGLAAHCGAVQTAVAREECVLHRIDAGQGGQTTVHLGSKL